MSQPKTLNKEYEPIYVVDYLRHYPTLEELWEENDKEQRSMPSLSTEENRHLSNILPILEKKKLIS